MSRTLHSNGEIFETKERQWGIYESIDVPNRGKESGLKQMTFLDLLQTISAHSETILAQSTNEIITQTKRYHRNGADGWVEDKEPGYTIQKWGRGGSFFIWVRETEDAAPLKKDDSDLDEMEKK